MDYIPQDISGEHLTPEAIDQEIELMHYNQYCYGMAVDRPRLWDLLNEKKRLEAQKNVRKA